MKSFYKTPQKLKQMQKEANFAKKSLGQNFLQDFSVLSAILDAAGDLAGKHVLEIGPGLGALTERLLAAGARVKALEIDERVFDVLKEKFQKYGDAFELVPESILDQSVDALYPDGQPYSVVANIPYHITGPILRTLLDECENRPQQALLMVQKEVAEKICTKRKGSLLSLSVKLYARAEKVITVPRTAFAPAPKVDSAVIRLTSYDVPKIEKKLRSTFFEIINKAFGQKRKMMRNTLPEALQLDEALLRQWVDLDRRPETLTIDEWVALTHTYAAWKKQNL